MLGEVMMVKIQTYHMKSTENNYLILKVFKTEACE